MNKPNIYFVISHPIQYFVPLYQRLAKQSDVSTKVFFFSDETVKGGVDKQFGVKFTWDIPLLAGYDYEFIKNRSLKPSIFNGFWGVFNAGIISALWKLPKGMVVVSGWHFSSYILCFFFASIFGHRVALRCEAPAFLEENRHGLRNKIRRILLRRVLLISMVDRCLYLGKENRAFYKNYGVEDERLVFTPYAIDNSRFLATAEQINLKEERANIGWDEADFIILFTGKFIDRKRPLDLIKAFHTLSLPNKKLLLVGDGNLRPEMEKYILEHNVQGVHFTGFINQKELPKYYVLSDVLVLCSQSETWGLSVNEAMACGLPVIVSDRVGCAKDLVLPGQNGFVFQMGNVSALSESMLRVYMSNLSGDKMGAMSKKIIEQYSPKIALEGIVSAAMSLAK